MKTTLTPRTGLLVCFFSGVLFTACSKDKIDVTESQLKQEAAKTTASNADNAGNQSGSTNSTTGKIKTITNSPNDAATDDLTYGSVKLTVSPSDAVGQIIIFNDEFSYETFTITGPGEFQFDNVRTGNYTVVVVPNDDSYKKKEITGVQVAESATSDLGNIVLEN